MTDNDENIVISLLRDMKKELAASSTTLHRRISGVKDDVASIAEDVAVLKNEQGHNIKDTDIKAEVKTQVENEQAGCEARRAHVTKGPLITKERSITWSAIIAMVIGNLMQKVGWI